MSNDKYTNIFSPQMEVIVFIILQIFFATRAVLKIGKIPRIFPSFSSYPTRARGIIVNYIYQELLLKT